MPDPPSRALADALSQLGHGRAPAPAGSVRAFAEAQPVERPRIEAGEDYTNDFARVMAEARKVHGPGRLGLLKWIDARGQMMRPALHAIDPVWMRSFEGYYASRKLIMLMRKGLRAGGSSSAGPVLTRCALFARRNLDAGTIGVIPIMSASRDEADGRFVTIRAVLRACGLTPPKKKTRGQDDEFGAEADDDGVTYVVPPGGLEGTFVTKRSQSGGGIIAIQDRHGHRIQFRILPALVKHGIGYTGAAGLIDESDLWPNDPEHHINPAEKIFEQIDKRFTTTHDDTEEDPGAELLILSASYNADSVHKRAIDDVLRTERGDKPSGRDPIMTSDIAYLARLGEEGARRDTESRRRLADLLGSDDPRLLAPADPLSPDLPTWAFNPSETIEKCYQFSKNNLSRMLALYGGRAAENATAGAACSAGDIAALAAFNREPRDGRRGPMRSDGLLQVPGYPGQGTARKYRGL